MKIVMILMLSEAVTRMMNPAATTAQRNDACFALRGDSSAETIAAMRDGLRDPKLRACAGTNLRLANAVDALTEALADDEAQVRAIAVRQLGAMAKPELLPALAKLAADPQLIVATNAIEALANYSDPSVLPYLLTIAKSGSMVAQLALNRAAQLKDPAVLPIAREMLAAKDVASQLTGIRIAGEMGDAGDKPALEKIAKTETEPVSASGRGFGLMPPISLSRAAKTAIERINERMPSAAR